MNYLTSPVVPIYIAVVATAGTVIIVALMARRSRKREAEAERVRMEERVRLRLAAERAPRGVTAAIKDPIRRVPRSASTPRPQGKRPSTPARGLSVPAPGRPGFRTDAPQRSDYDVTTPLLMAMLMDQAIRNDSNSGNDTSRNDSPSYDPSPQPNPSYDSGSSSSYDGGSSSSDSGSFGGGDSGSF